MSISLPNSLVELRFQVPTVLLDAACKAIAPYVMNASEAETNTSADSSTNAAQADSASTPRFVGVTQNEVRMLLKGCKH